MEVALGKCDTKDCKGCGCDKGAKKKSGGGRASSGGGGGKGGGSGAGEESAAGGGAAVDDNCCHDCKHPCGYNAYKHVMSGKTLCIDCIMTTATCAIGDRDKAAREAQVAGAADVDDEEEGESDGDGEAEEEE